ncbi:hypothetical protein SK128_024128 [Halocaridina rubra]|uniref:Uncharacterized protein n=1 Tax=Halocaridina rubra TaxID=373956 RepID=A0AAN9A6D3_HALRR
MGSRPIWIVFFVTIFFALSGVTFYSSYDIEDGDEGDNGGHSLQKRFLFMSSDRVLGFPQGTNLYLDLTLSMPGIRNMPDGYTSIMTLSADLAVSLDDLGFTNGENPFFFFPYYDVVQGRDLPGVNSAGGDRLLMFEFIEGLLESIGMEGRPCLLRAICEVFEVPLNNHGFIGEILELFLSATRAPYAEMRAGDYVAAERAGRNQGNCSSYTRSCIHSLFATYLTDEPKLVPVSDESRQKRFLYFTRERRLTLPPGSVFILTPVITFPFRGDVPYGFSGYQMNGVFQILLDEFGLTSEENPWGIIEGLDEAFSQRRHTVTRRSDPMYPGGDRDMFYNIIEDTLHNFGLNGKACVLRAICEMFQFPLDNHGFFAEFLELFFSVSNSRDAELRLSDYVAAERTGRTTGDCSAYFDSCPLSLFKNPLETHHHP